MYATLVVKFGDDLKYRRYCRGPKLAGSGWCSRLLVPVWFGFVSKTVLFFFANRDMNYSNIKEDYEPRFKSQLML